MRKQDIIRKCCVPHCSSTTKNKHLTFHRFPCKEEIVSIITADGEKIKLTVADAWKLKLNIKEYKPSWLVCSNHFTANDFFVKRTPGSRTILKLNAVPTMSIAEQLAIHRFKVEESFEGEIKTEPISTKCCVCLIDENTRNIVETKIDNITVAEALELCTSFVPQKNPKELSICMDCFDELQRGCDFRNKYIKSSETLNSE